ncbi:unnamed protein product [Heligmosomoides polygyrus]|uniref:Mismatch repair endonuclease PMS2 n=1 Tax=Heligmosomoides polygyrus TaxID=6339 RepID=A0A3P7YV52_HELPZ|nr:unnamed protein product [Heligmosomoides polygyrus]
MHFHVSFFSEIRVKNNGFESVEVIDDGTGIEAENFDSLCKPHSTSKLSCLNDFSHLSTLGFRGEALNALCALSSITITTRCRSSPLGTKLRFDHSGNVVERTTVARSVGTTVVIDSLFDTLPVRRKEFEKTAKKEFGRVLTAVQSFALSRPDVKFICGNTIAGKRQQLICTPGRASIRDVVTNLFGGRTDKNKMVDIVRCLPSEEVSLFRIGGFVSSCEHGYGRSAADRQFVYVNQRPVDCAKICRVVNEVYQQYNRSQYPTLVLNIDVPPGMIDVNVTPDKRMVFFEREKELLALIRSSLLATFHPLLGSYTSVEDNKTNVSAAYVNSGLVHLLFLDIEDPSSNLAPSSSSTAPLTARNALFSLLKSNSEKSSSTVSDGPQPKRSKTSDSFSSKVWNYRTNSQRRSLTALSGEMHSCGKYGASFTRHNCRKSEFIKMSVVGQFNKGFIITRLRDHLFLVDQHASDEKYNFERFQRKARVETQRLIHPQPLDLGAVQASALRDNLSIMEANGFGFEFKESGKRWLHCPSWLESFLVNLRLEILTVVSEFPGVMYRPAKLRRIFASRACRKSVMIGTALTTAQMQSVIKICPTNAPAGCRRGGPCPNCRVPVSQQCGWACSKKWI